MKCYRHDGRGDSFRYLHDGHADYSSYSHDGRADYMRYSHDGRKNKSMHGRKKIQTGTYNLYVKLGYQFSLSWELQLQFARRRAENIGNRHDRRADVIC